MISQSILARLTVFERVFAIGQEDRNLHEIADGHICSFELCKDIRPDKLGLFTKTFRQRAAAGHGDLTADVKPPIAVRCFQGLRIAADGLRGRLGVDRSKFQGHRFLSSKYSRDPIGGPPGRNQRPWSARGIISARAFAFAASRSPGRRKCRTPRRSKTRNLPTPARPPSMRVLRRGQSDPSESSTA
jgi:hypothetical protein